MKNKKTILTIGLLLLAFFPLVEANEWYLDDGRCNIGEPCNEDCDGYYVDGGLTCECLMGFCETITDGYSFAPFPWVDYNARCQYVEPMPNDGICNWGEQCSEECLGYKTCTSFSCFWDNAMCIGFYWNGLHYSMGIADRDGITPEAYKIVCNDQNPILKIMEAINE